MADIDDGEVSAWLEHADELTDRGFAPGSFINVVKRPT
jgi:hypothetical protein